MRARRQAGLTLVELLIALFAMSLLAVLAWRGLDGMTRAQAYTETRADEVLTLQTGLAQWGADLEAMEQLRGMKAIEWNGRVLRLTRRSTANATEGVIVVGWARRNVPAGSLWMRWQSPPVATRGDIEQAWQRADLWAQNQGGGDAREVAIAPLEDWQVFYFRDNAWTNPQSSDITASIVATAQPPAGATSGAAAPNTAPVPDGVRIVLSLPAGGAIGGQVTRDWVRPQVTPQ